MNKQDKSIRMLELLSENPMRYKQLKKAMKVSDPTLAKYLKDLEKQEYIVLNRSTKEYGISQQGKSYLNQLSAMQKVESMSATSISPSNFAKIWERLARVEGKMVMHEALHSTIAFLTKEEKEALKKGKFEIPTGDFIPATVFFWFDKENRDLLEKMDNFIPVVNNLIEMMRIAVATVREGEKPNEEGLRNNVKELKWLKASYGFECAVLIHFNARNRTMLKFLEEQIRRGEQRLKSVSK
jgi:DNA-binding HxlR family transcriptional regulator